MAEEKNTTVEDFQKEIDDRQQAAVDAREAAGPDQGETEEEYRQRIASVPGIFGDTDTTFGNDVVAADNEQATVDQAEAEVAAEEGDEEAADQAASGAARRQTQVQAAGETAEEVDAAADDSSDSSDSSDSTDSADEKKTSSRSKK